MFESSILVIDEKEEMPSVYGDVCGEDKGYELIMMNIIPNYVSINCFTDMACFVALSF